MASLKVEHKDVRVLIYELQHSTYGWWELKFSREGSKPKWVLMAAAPKNTPVPKFKVFSYPNLGFPGMLPKPGSPAEKRLLSLAEDAIESITEEYETLPGALRSASAVIAGSGPIPWADGEFEIEMAMDEVLRPTSWWRNIHATEARRDGSFRVYVKEPGVAEADLLLFPHHGTMSLRQPTTPYKEYGKMRVDFDQDRKKLSRIIDQFISKNFPRSRRASAVIVGDIFVSSWGYDQTNIDFYQVVGTTPKMLSLRPIDKRVVSGRGEPQEKVIPLANKFTGPAIRKKLKEGWQGRPWINLNSYSGASKWDGKPATQTGGVYGH